MERFSHLAMLNLGCMVVLLPVLSLLQTQDDPQNAW